MFYHEHKHGLAVLPFGLPVLNRGKEDTVYGLSFARLLHGEHLDPDQLDRLPEPWRIGAYHVAAAAAPQRDAAFQGWLDTLPHKHAVAILKQVDEATIAIQRPLPPGHRPSPPGTAPCRWGAIPIAGTWRAAARATAAVAARYFAAASHPSRGNTGTSFPVSGV